MIQFHTDVNMPEGDMTVESGDAVEIKAIFSGLPSVAIKFAWYSEKNAEDVTSIVQGGRSRSFESHNSAFDD